MVWRDKTEIGANLIGSGSLNKTIRLKYIINKDCPFETDNCRGIIVISCMLKIFTIKFNDNLMKWSDIILL